MRLHLTANGKAYGWSTPRSLFDFFFPRTWYPVKKGDRLRTQYIRNEATAMDDGIRVHRNFYTFRAFFWTYFNILRQFLAGRSEQAVRYAVQIGMSPTLANRIGAIALDTSDLTTGAADTGKTTAYTVTGSNPLLLVDTWTNIDGTDRNDTCSYAAAGMTSAGTYNKAGTGGYGKKWYQLGGATGSNNVATHYTSSTYNRTFISSYSGVKQTGFPDNSTTNTANAASITTTLTPIADNCWTQLGCSEGIGTTLSAGAATTIRRSSTDSNCIADSNAAITPAASTSLIISSSGTGQFATLMVSFAPFVAVTTGMEWNHPTSQPSSHWSSSIVSY